MQGLNLQSWGPDLSWDQGSDIQWMAPTMQVLLLKKFFNFVFDFAVCMIKSSLLFPKWDASFEPKHTLKQISTQKSFGLGHCKFM